GAQKFYPIRRYPWRGDDRSADLVGGENHRGQALAGIRSLVLLHQLGKCRDLGQERVTLFAGLHDYVNEALLAPGVKWLAREECRDGGCPALYFAALPG